MKKTFLTTLITFDVRDLKPIEVAIYAILRRWAKKDKYGYYSDLTEQQIADKIGAKRNAIVNAMKGDFLSKLSVEKYKIKVDSLKWRYVYRFRKVAKFFFVASDIIDSYSYKELGMLLKLYANGITESKKAICEQINVSMPTLNKYWHLTDLFTAENFPKVENRYVSIIRQFCALKGAKLGGVNKSSMLLLPYYESRFKGDFRAFLTYIARKYKTLPKYTTLNYFSRAITRERVKPYKRNTNYYVSL